MYYIILTGRFPFTPGDVNAMYKTLCLQDFVAINLPANLQVSDCCRHFLRHHLFKNPDDRICDEEAGKHPFVMPTVRILLMTKPVNSDVFLKPMIYEVELGEIYFRNAKEKLGAAINEPHPFSKYEAEPIRWGDVARVVGITNPADLDDMLVFTNGGVCCNKDTPVEMKGIEDIVALIVSSKNGIQIGDMKMIEGVNLPDADMNVMNSTEKPGTVDCLNQHLISFSNFIKCCRENIRVFQTITTNCDFIGQFRLNVLKTDYLAKKLRDLQEEVCQKFDRFPKVGFCPPNVDSVDLPNSDNGTSTIDAIRVGLGNVRVSAQSKISCSSAVDLTDEMKQIALLWEQYKGFVAETKKQLVTVCGPMKSVMVSIQKDVEVMTRLTQYINVLQKALKSTDVSVIYGELLPLVKCDYFRVSDDDMKLLENPKGLKQEPPPEPIAPAVVPSAAAAATAAPVPSAAKIEGNLDDYVTFLTEQYDMLELNCAKLRSQYDLFEQQRSTLDASTSKTIGNLDTVIQNLRAQLEAHGIPDPLKE